MSTAALALILMLADSIPKHPETAPVPTHRVDAQYTPEERAAGIEGEVWISAMIDEQGVPANLKVTRSLHPRLDAQALAAAAQWRFKPGTRDQHPITMQVTLAISFRLAAVQPK